MDAGVVDDAIEPSEVSDGLVDGSANVGFDGNIASDREVLGAQFAGHGSGSCFVAVENGDQAPLFGEHATASGPDSAGASANHDYTILKTHVFLTL
jgi:hypothetical protein